MSRFFRTTTRTMSLEAVFESIVARDLPKLKTLLESKPTLALQTNDRSWTPLHMAARYGYSDGIKLLLNFKADPKALTKDAKSPIDLALSWSNTEAAKELGWKENDAVTFPAFTDPDSKLLCGSPLNRSSELRSNESFLQGTLPGSKFIPLKRLNVPMKDNKILFLTHSDVEASLSQNKDGHTLVFLGVDPEKTYHWAFDATSQSSVLEAVTKLGGEFKEFRPAAFDLPPKHAAIAAQARAIVDWNARNQFCPACGSKTISAEAGYKRKCPTTDCLAQKGVQNFSYPRTDPVVIMCIISKDGERCLLGRQKTWPKKRYSCLAGFLESGESLEEGARREAFEESAVRVGRVSYHSSQPWPFPANSCYTDKELEHAQWYTRQEVLEALKVTEGPAPDAPLLLPPSYAIAHTIIKAWAEGSFSFSKDESKPKI
ncbi:NUDIX hydrolase domain-like protein [Chytridium lagenaria]|nr:NUDIX hydrolase domain-like protein [Chytridium lagenaria]